MTGNPERLLLDANVLIDFQDSDFSVLRDVKENVAEIFVLRYIFEKEIPDLTEQICNKVGLVIIQPKKSVIEESEIKIGQLSTGDRLNLFTALDSEFSLVTNDKKLRKVCEERKGKVIWGLQLLVILVENSEYSIDDAISIGEKIGENNVRITDKDVGEFIKKLEKIRKSRT